MDIICIRFTLLEQITSISEYMVYLKFLPEEKCERLSRYIRKGDFLRSLAADLLIRVLLGKQLGLKNSDIQIESNAYGKPYLATYPVEFNVSHSGEWVVAVVGQSPVGIDVEKIQPIEMDIAKRFFAEK
ncbi:4'-phosphopantetheinyl transferase [Paenibacillus sp. FSL R7-277]|uniref:4'-phosphopantetheinyl transferase family protein n=1 Tax=unclassified Paenibacillus TaxID=185978 RepID=UPI0003E1D3B3|nr:hypothetical protein [Paenibacillus sp. FSL R7-277]ETT65410.1 4'-phosphopantetheinyl transferase [Paenibacillus sp. FSL R7-277]